MTSFKFLPLYGALLVFTACSQPAVKASQPEALATTQQAAADAAADEAAKAAKAKQEATYPKQALTPDILFKFLVAEVAGQRGAMSVAQPAYMDLARQTRDPRIARRATEVSMFARNQTGALEAAQLWAAVEPDSERAQQTVVGLLLNEGKLEEAEPILRNLLKQDPANVFMQMSAMMGKIRDHQAALAMTERLAADYPSLPEAHFSVAQAAAHDGRMDVAVDALKQAETLRPGWEPAALMRAQILANTSLTDAMTFMRNFLVTYPDANEVRLAYARSLVSANQIAEARAEFTRLTEVMPRNAEVTLAAGLLALQEGDFGVAQGLLTDTLEYGPRDADMVHFYLGQVAERMKQPDVAAAEYAEVKTGNYLVPARARQAALLVQAGRPKEAQALLAFTHGENDAQSVRLIQAQAELLGDSKQYAQAFETLSEGIKRYPDAADLYYDRAMVAEKLGKLDLVEKDLRKVIALRPDNAQAYNALGYTLADRTNRLAEAITLLDKALSLSPNDAYILDSVGWAQYRAGNLAKAQEYLDRAYKLRPDPEIAAHLGEVLWARGQRDEAGRLWQTSLQMHPQNEVLLETLHRLNP
jgi:tetratricopeptide (TPR) repeat protein